MASSLTHRDRLETSLSGGKVDRLPIALWRHFPVADQRPDTLARMILEFQARYDFDLIKVTPASSYCLVDFGSKDEWKGNPEGVREYTHQVIQHPEDWGKLPLLDPRQGSLGMVLEALRLIKAGNQTGAPIIQTIFNPMSQAKNLAGRDRLIHHLRAYPDQVKVGLEILTKNILTYLDEVRKIGIDGIFYAVQHAQYSILSAEEFRTFSRAYDLRILKELDGFWLNMLHLHGEDGAFDWVADYPVQIINWHDRENPVDLPAGLVKTKAAACGGISRLETMLNGEPDEVAAQVRSAADSTGGRRLIIGTGCVMMTTTPQVNIEAACQAAHEYKVI